MRKKFIAIYALAGALVVSPVFTSCVDDTVSPQVEAQREANIKYKNALTAQTEANTAINQANAANTQAMAALNQEAKRLENEALAAQNAYNEANRALELASKELDLAQKEFNQTVAAYNQALAEKKEAMILEKLQLEVEQQKVALEQAKANVEQTKANNERQKLLNESQQITNEKAKATLELDILKAKLDAEALNAQAQAELLEAQAKLEKVIKGLELKEQAVAEQMRKNALAIMNGGTANFAALDGWSGSEMSQTYNSTYWKNQINSIMALNNGLVSENHNLLVLENDLKDIKTWIAEEVAKYEGQIATENALIAKYKEFQAEGSNKEDLQEVYEEAALNETTIGKQMQELLGDIYYANKAVNDHNLAMNEDAIVKLIYSGYLTAMDQEEYADTITTADGISTNIHKHWFDAVYEHTAEDAEELATAITDKEKEIADTEENIANLEAYLEKINNTDIERELALAKAAAEPVQKLYDDAKASEAYKTYIADLEKAVEDAQKAFNENPTDIPTYFEFETNEDGSIKADENGNPIQIKIQGTKQDLIEAEDALANEKFNFFAVEDDPETPEWEGKTLWDLTWELEHKYMFDYSEREDHGYWDDVLQEYIPNWVWVTYNVNGLNGAVKYYEEKVINDLANVEQNLENENTRLEYLNKELEALKEIQTNVAADSEAMKDYLALCEERAELQKALFDLYFESDALNYKKNYYTNLKSALSEYIEEGNNNSLPDWADLIAACEKNIATYESNIDEMAGTNKDNNWGENQINKEALITAKKAEIEAMEAELEVRQAEYDAVMAALEALLEAETEVAE